MARVSLRDQRRLSKAADLLTDAVRERCKGTGVRIRKDTRPSPTQTGGWMMKIASLGTGLPQVEVWLDQFTGHPTRKFSVALASADAVTFWGIVSKLKGQAAPTRTLSKADQAPGSLQQLKRRLRPKEFDRPIRENYTDRSFLSLFVNGDSSPSSDARFVALATAFVETIARSIYGVRIRRDDREYSAIENRSRVVSHLRRERKPLLAARCKERDHYACRVCGFHFEERYGVLGRTFAEAHHTRPLSSLKGATRTRVEDLVTVCANCHRMLHRMKGDKGDVPRLRRALKRRRKT